MKILIIDDNQMILKAMSIKLKEHKYEVFTTIDAVEALALLAEKKIDLVISDIIMPCISGFTFLNMMRNFYYSSVPVILISSYTEKELIKRARELGANYFIDKPINYNLLISKIEEIASVTNN